jgi:hypothetical protein
VYKDRNRHKTLFPDNNTSFTIGWIGSRTTSYFLDELSDILISFSERNAKVRFILIGYYGVKFKGIPNADIVTYDDDHYVDKLLEFDLGIMPGNDSDIFRYKSAYKFVQYIYYGIPAIAFRNEVSEDVNRGLKNFLFSDRRQLYDYLTLLINDRERLAEIGKHNNVNRDKYSINTYLTSYDQCITSLLNTEGDRLADSSALL